MLDGVHYFAHSVRLTEAIVEQLQLAGFGPRTISVRMPDKHVTRLFARQHHTRIPQEAAAMAGAGGLVLGAGVGAAFGWLISLGTLSVPGGELPISAGPLLSTLIGAAMGAVLGGILGTVVGKQLSAFEVKRDEKQLQAGNILISVYTDNNLEAKRARDIFKVLESLDKSSEKRATTAENSQTPSQMEWHCAA